MSERLTIPDYRITHDDGSVTTRRSFIDGEKVREHAWELYKRLKEYEDACFDDPNEDTSREVIPTARIRELAEAEREGRLVVLPCKRGTTFFAVNKDRGYIYEQDYDYPEVILMENRRNGKSGNRGYTFLDKGKKTKIYLSRAEAERALSATEPKGGLDGK